MPVRLHVCLPIQFIIVQLRYKQTTHMRIIRTYICILRIHVCQYTHIHTYMYIRTYISLCCAFPQVSLYEALLVLPVLDYCDAVWHECGQGNSAKIEWLQRRAARIVYMYMYFKAASNLSTDQIITKLGWKPLYSRRQENILRFVRILLKFENLKIQCKQQHELNKTSLSLLANVLQIEFPDIFLTILM